MGTLKHPAALDELLLYRLYVLQKAGRERVERSYRDALGISLRDHTILALVARSPGTTLSELAAASGMDVVVASRCVSCMVTRRLLSKSRRQGNNRFAQIQLTEAGEQAHARAIEIGTRYSEALTCGLSDDEATALDSMLTALTARARTLASTTDSAPHV
jgi:DNA-binding MarR family transcriptional regulator